MFNNKEYVQKLNQLFQENKKEEFFTLADKLKSLFFGEINRKWCENKRKFK